MTKVIEQKGNFDSSILNGFREVSLALGNKAKTWKAEHVGHEMGSDWVNQHREQTVFAVIPKGNQQKPKTNQM